MSLRSAFQGLLQRLLLLALALLVPVAAWAGAIPINNGTGAFAGSFNNALYAIDFDTGKAVLLYTDAAVSGINSLGFDPVKGIYYYADNNAATTNHAIYGYDARTGQRFTLVADVTTYGVNLPNGSGLGQAGGEFANNAYYFSTEGGGAGNRDQFFKVTIDPASNGRTATGLTAVGTDNFNGNTEFGDFLIDEATQKLYVFNSGTGVDEYTIGAGSLTYGARDANTSVRQAARDRNNVFYDVNTGFRAYNPTAGTFGTVKTITTNGTTGLGALFDGAAYLPAEASLGDRIFFDTNANGVDDGEDGVDGLTVELFDDLNNNGVVDAGETLLATRTTDATGAYLFDKLLPGDYIIRVSDPTNILNGGAATTSGGLIQRESIRLIGTSVLTHDFGFQDKRPSITLSSPSVTEGTNAYATFTLGLSASYTSAISVSLALANGTAIAADYGPGLEVSTNGGTNWTAAATASFAAGSTSILVRTPIIDDAIDENSENFTLTATRTAGRAKNSSAVGTATIADNDPTPSLVIDDISRNENAGTATFTVTLSAASGLTVTVDYASSNGSATAGSDYTAKTGTLTFNPGATTQTIVVALLDDAVYEGNEAFNMVLSNAANATIADGTGVCTIIENDNAVPVANADTATTPEDTAITVAVLANDTDANGDTLTVTTATVPVAQGAVVINANNTVTFTPALNFNGAATISYSISDGRGGTASSTATITVSPVNDAPVAVNDTASTPEDTAKDINVLANDTDVDGDTLSVTTATVPAAQGTVTINADKTLHFVPKLNFNGTATISYSISDGNGGTASAQVTVTVTAVNDPPVAVNDTASTPEDTAKDIDVLANDTDVDGDTLSVSTATVPAAQGTVSINADKTLHFVPKLNFNGTASISYSISDGNGGTASATVTVTVSPVNDAPVAVNDAASTLEDTATDIAVLTNDTDVDGDTLSVTTATVPAAQGTVTINADKTLHFVPALNFNGTATISYSISDGNGGSASAQVIVTVTPVNDPPVAVNDTASTPEDTAKDIDVLGNDSDVDGDTLSVTIATVPAAEGTVTINANKTLHFVPALNYNGTATISYSISDGNGGAASASLTVTVTSVNDAPIAINDTASTPEDTAVNITVLTNDTDGDGDTLGVTGASVPAVQGTVSVNPDGSLHFTPALNFNGTATINYSISDGNGGTASATVTVTVTPVNDAPVALNDSASTPEATPVDINVLANDSDVDGDALTVTTATVPAAQGVVTINADGSLHFVPTALYNGPATISYSISDGHGGTASALVNVSVAAVNDPPVAVNDTASTPEDTAKIINVLANDSDPDGDTLSVTTATVPAAQGTVAINPDKTLLFTPALNFNGTATITYAISDGNGGTATATATVTITPVNDAPVAVNDAASTPEDVAVEINALANDSDVDGDALLISTATVPAAQGTVSINADNTLHFVPALNFNGVATISYSISDGNGGSASAQVAVTVTPVNDPPVAVNDAASTPEDTAKDINVLANDTDVDGDTLSVTSASVPAAQGTVAINADKTLHFVPKLNFNGPATISYSISDGNGGTASAQVIVTVTPVNDPPVAVDDTASTPEDTVATINVLGNDTDIDGDALTVTTASVPAAQGTVSVNADNTLKFTPALNFNGPATISYSISDGHSGTASAQVIVTVTPVNDAPVAVNDATSTPEDTAKTYAVLTNDSDVDGDPLTVTSATVPAAQGSAVVNADNTVTFTPAANFNGLAIVSYSISDGNGGAASAQLAITVTAVNDAPVAVNDVATTLEDTAVDIDVLVNDSDLDGDTLTVVAASVAPARGTVTVNANGTLHFAPALNYNGPASISYTISDGQGGNASALVAVTVTPVNDPPVALNDVSSTPEDTPLNIDVLGNDSDVDGDPLTVTTASVPAAQGTVSINADGTLHFTPALNFNGPATIAYSISDGNGGAASAQVTVTVTPVNDAPVAVNDSATTPEDTVRIINVLGNDSDLDGDPLSVSGATVPASEGAVSVNPDGTLLFTPAPNFNGLATLSYTISDGNGGSASAQVFVTVTPVNDPPVAVNDTASTNEDTAVDITVLTNDSDVDGDSLSVISASVPAAQGGVAVNADGTLHFTPAANFNGPATISYTISDGHGGNASAQVAVNVVPVNDAPVALDDAATTPEDTTKVIAVLANDTDPENDALTVTTASVAPAEGTVSINADGTLLFTPALNFNGTATIAYSISDGHGGAASAVAIVTVTPVNDPPVALDDATATDEEVAKIIAVLGNDSDADGDTLTVTTATIPGAQGTVTIRPDGTLLYDPALLFNGTATITYSISDGHGGTAIAHVTVNVTPVNHPPVANPDSATTPEDTAVDITVLTNDTDPDGDPLTILSATVAPEQGIVSVNANNTLHFVPALNFNGTASITYTIDDSRTGQAFTAVSVTVTPVNDAPVAVDDTASTTEDTAVNVTVLTNDTDVDGDVLGVTGASVPAAQGTVSVNGDGTLLFTPAANFNGTATITYSISDGNGGTATAKAIVTVGAVNDAPVAVDDIASTPEDTAKTIAVLANDTDPENDPLSVTAASVPAAQGTVSINADGTLLYAPAKDFNGTALIAYTIGDGNGGTASAKVTVTVTPVNDPPVAVNDSASTPEDTAVDIDVLPNDSDIDGDTLTVKTATIPAAQGVVTINANGTLHFVPAADFNGTATISYTIDDGHGATASAQAIVTVTPVNDAPIAVNDTATTPEDTAADIVVLANDTDPENDPLSVTTASVPAAQGTVSVNADGTLHFVPAQDFNGTALIAYTIGDGHGGSASAQVTVTVTPVNDAPLAVNDLASTMKNIAVDVDVLSNDSDVDGDSLTVTLATVAAAQGSVTVNANGTLHFVPANNFKGQGIISYTISDGHGGTASAQATVSIFDTNAAPIAVDDSATTAEDTAVTINVLANDSDPDDDPIIVTAATVPANEGTVSINADGTLLFTPARDFHGAALISYTITDLIGAAASAKVAVTITPVNDGPVAVDDVASTQEDTPLDVPVLSNDSDVDNDTLIVTAATVPPAQGTVSINVDGTLRFVPAKNFNGTATIDYSIADGNGGTASAKAVITVGAVNDKPIAADDLASTTGQSPVKVNVAANDTDPENDALTVQSAAVMFGMGSVVVDDASNLTFTAAPGFHGLALIEYVIADAGGATATAIVRIYVNAPPQAAPDAAVTQKNTAVTVSVLANDSDADLSDVLTITSALVDPAFGTAQVSPDQRKVTFTPAAGLAGAAQLTYTITDGHGGFAESTITVTIANGPVNQPPQAVSDHAVTAPATPVGVPALANDTDPENDPLTLQTATVLAAEGTVTANGASLSFTPASGFTGAATITYTISDGQGNTAQGIAIVEVTAGNQPPMARDDSGQAASGTPKVFNVALNDLDPDNDPLTVQTATVTTAGAGVVVVNPDGTLTFTPAAGFTGPAQITYVIADPSGATAQATLTVEVVPTLTNTPPITENDTASTLPGQIVTIAPLTNDKDAEGDILSVKTATVPPAQGTVTIQPDGTVIFTPAPGFTGLVRIDYIAMDANGGEAPGVITVLVNTPPVANPNVSQTGAGQQVTFNVLTNDTDADGHALDVVTYSTDPSQGTIAITAAGQLTFTPAANFSGPATFTYIIEDELHAQAEGRIRIMVNDPPAAPNTTAQTQVGTPITLNVLASATDPNGDPIHIAAATVDPAQGTVTIEPDGTLLFTPAPAFTGPAVIDYLVADKWGAVTRATVTIGRANVAPETEDRLVYAFCGVPLNINALRGASDLDGDTLTILSVTQGKSGRVTILPDGRVLYKPGIKFNDPTNKDSFTVTVSDSKGGVSTLTIQVAAFNSLVGNYLGLVTDSSTGTAAGLMKITMGKAATFSGFFQYGTVRAPFVSRLGSHLDSTIKLKLKGQPNARLHVAFDTDTLTFSGEVTGVGNSPLTLGTVRPIAKRQAATNHVFTGKYHADVRIHGSTDLHDPVGDFLVTVNASGMLTVTGYLPDGRVFSTGSGVFTNGQIPIFRAYGPSGTQTGGYVAGFIVLDPMTPAAALSGTLDQDFGAPGQLDLMPPTP